MVDKRFFKKTKIHYKIRQIYDDCFLDIFLYSYYY